MFECYFAELAMDEASRDEPLRIINATVQILGKLFSNMRMSWGVAIPPSYHDGREYP